MAEARAASSAWDLSIWYRRTLLKTRSDRLFESHIGFSTGGYSVNGGPGENTYGRKSLGQELRVNNVTNADFTSVPHGSRALATKDMRKSQGKEKDPLAASPVFRTGKEFTRWILFCAVRDEMMLMEAVILCFRFPAWRLPPYVRHISRLCGLC